jgi:tripartite-type tricarboxylate transporter receptor subunit TctC
MREARSRLACLSVLAVILGAPPVASGQDEFYRGKTIRIVVGYSPGGGFDTYSRAIGRHIANISRLYALPPSTPTDRVRTRAAFIKTLSDPEFVAEARQAELDIDPIPGEEVERLIGQLFRMPPPVHAKLKELLR